MNNKILDLLSKVENTPKSGWEITKLHGDASYRTYYRASAKGGQSYIILQMPDGISSASEEITNYEGKKTELPFINIQRSFLKLSIPAPRLIKKTKDEKFLILEDLGDDLFFNNVENRPAETQKSWYQKAIDLLVFLHRSMIPSNDNNCLAFRRSFDATLLNWEFDHFLKYGIEVITGSKMDKRERDIFTSLSRGITKKIERIPYEFTHRDFQSRNLIWHNERLYLIDFQDALMGPHVYDLVSLLRDSYVKLNDRMVEELVRYYCDKSGHDPAATMEGFHLVTVQRKLKDAGRFVYIDRVKGNPNFLKNIPTSLDYVKCALDKLPEEKDFYAFLKRHITEWNK